MERLIDRLAGVGAPWVALYGDFMLDRYVYGDVERLSPEAPVVVLESGRSESRAGGAGNVAGAVCALGGCVECVGLIGSDSAGDALASLLAGCGASTSGLVREASRPTTVKTRYVGLAQHRHRQQLLRLDEEVCGPVEGAGALAVREGWRRALGRCAVAAIQDHDKGAMAGDLGLALIADARAAGVRVIVDPAAIGDYGRYRGATVLTPNRYETERASGVAIVGEASLARASAVLLDCTGAEAVVITLDREGAWVQGRDGGGRLVATRSRAVYDVTGAGDEVVAMLSLSLAWGFDLVDAVALANVAGGLEVERFGVVPVSREEVLDELVRLARGESGANASVTAAPRHAMGHRAVFLDRDGTLIEDPGYLSDPAGVRLLGGVAGALGRLQRAGWKLVVVTNQSGVARGLLTESRLRAVHDALCRQLADEGVLLDAIYYCPYYADGHVGRYAVESPLRKPAPGMLMAAASDLGIDLSASWMVGDAAGDIGAGVAAGCRTIRLGQGVDGAWSPDHRVSCLADAAGLILADGLAE